MLMILKTSFFPNKVVEVPQVNSSVNGISTWFPQYISPHRVSSENLSNKASWALQASLISAGLLRKVSPTSLSSTSLFELFI